MKKIFFSCDFPYTSYSQIDSSLSLQKKMDTFHSFQIFLSSFLLPPFLYGVAVIRFWQIYTHIFNVRMPFLSPTHSIYPDLGTATDSQTFSLILPIPSKVRVAEEGGSVHDPLSVARAFREPGRLGGYVASL